MEEWNVPKCTFPVSSYLNESTNNKGKNRSASFYPIYHLDVYYQKNNMLDSYSAVIYIIFIYVT
jgi:hypothetical protein